MLMKVIFRQGLAKLEVGRLEVGAVHTVLQFGRYSLLHLLCVRFFTIYGKNHLLDLHVIHNM